MKKIIIYSLWFVFGSNLLLASSSSPSQKTSAGAEESPKASILYLSFALSTGDTQAFNTFLSVHLEELQKNGLSPEKAELNLRECLVTQHFFTTNQSSGIIDSVHLSKAMASQEGGGVSPGFMILKDVVDANGVAVPGSWHSIQSKDHNGKLCTNKVRGIKISLPIGARWDYLTKLIGQKLFLNIPIVGISEEGLDAVKASILPEIFCFLSPLDIALFFENQAMVERIVDFVLVHPRAWAATLGHLLCSERTQDFKTVPHPLPDLYNSWPLKRLQVMIKQRPELKNIFVHRRDLELWLSGVDLALVPKVLGRVDASGLQVPVPGVFFTSRAKHIPALKAFVDAGAHTNYGWKDGVFQPIAGLRGSNFNSTLLSLAAVAPEARVLAELLRGGADPNICCPLYFAARSGHLPSMKVLLDAKAEINGTYKLGGTALVPTAQFGHTSVCKLLCDLKANVNFQLDDGITPTYFASQEGHSDALRVLIGAKANPNLLENTRQVSPLYIATSQFATPVSGNPESSAEMRKSVIEILIEGKANVNHRRSDNEGTPLACAVSKGVSHNVCLGLLLSAKADPNLNDLVPQQVGARLRWPIFEALRQKNIEALRMMLKGPIKCRTTQGRSSLLYNAVSMNRPDIVRILIHGGCTNGTAQTFVSLPPELPQRLRLDRSAFRRAVEGRMLGSLQELALLRETNLVSGKKWICDNHCGFTGSFKEFKKHIDTCLYKVTTSAGSGLTSEELSLDELATPKKPVYDGGTTLDLFRDAGVEYVSVGGEGVGQICATSQYINLVKGFSRFHHIAVAGDAYAMYHSLTGSTTGFHKGNFSRLSVKSIIEQAKDRKFLKNYFGPSWEQQESAITGATYAPYEERQMKYLAEQAGGAWSPSFEVHKYFGKPASVCIESLITYAYILERTVPASDSRFLTHMLRYVGRDWFEYDREETEGLKRRLAESRYRERMSLSQNHYDGAEEGGAYKRARRENSSAITLISDDGADEGGAYKRARLEVPSELIQINTSDDEVIPVDDRLAKHSTVLKELIKSSSEEDGASSDEEDEAKENFTVQVPFSSKDLQKILSFLELYENNHYEHSMVFPGYFFTSNYPQYCKSFFQKLLFSSPACKDLLSFLKAADFLRIEPILWAGEWALASYFKGKKPSEQRQILDIKFVSDEIKNKVKERVQDTYPCFELMRQREEVMSSFSEEKVQEVLELEIRKKEILETLPEKIGDEELRLKEELRDVTEELNELYAL